jgi:hypothetical protein
VGIAAVSSADPTKLGSTTVTITGPAVSLSVSPVSATIPAGKTLQFAVAVRNTSNAAVTWKVNGTTGGNATLGTITTAGLYKAPATAPSAGYVTVSAVSSADATKSAAAIITVTSPTSVTVDVSPDYAKVALGQTQQFTATVANTLDTVVQWQVNGVAGGDAVNGSISSTGLYTAPVAVPGAPVFVTAVSSADPSATGTAQAALMSPIPVAISVVPSRIFLLTGGAGTALSVVVENTSDTSVSWYVEGVLGGNDAVGHVVDNIYSTLVGTLRTAPVTLTAVSNADRTKFASTVVEFVNADPDPIIAIGPIAPIVQAGQLLHFAATVQAPPWDGTTVSWAVNGTYGGDSIFGTISLEGLYTAPSTVPPSAVVVEARVLGRNGYFSASTTVTVTPSPAVTISPALVEVQTGTTQQFSSVVVGLATTSVTWAVNGVVGGSTTTGTIDAAGLFSAPATVPNSPSVTVSAVSTADGTWRADATVTVVATAPVLIGWGNWANRGTNAMAVVNGTFVFDAWVMNAADASLTYFVNGVAGGAPATGTITNFGVYTAPSEVPIPATVTIAAVANAYPTKSVSGTMTITPAPSPLLYLVAWNGFVFPPCWEQGIGVGQWVSFQPYTEHSIGNTIRFQVSGVAGGDALFGTIDADGLYKAPSSVPPGGLVFITASLAEHPTTQALVRVYVHQ